MKKVLYFPTEKKESWQSFIELKVKELKRGLIEINSGNWQLKCRDIIYLKNLCERYNLTIVSINSYIPETIISANSLGFESSLELEFAEKSKRTFDNEIINSLQSPSTFFHQGTLRSGESLDVNEDLLILGDVNPGAIVSAGGNVMIWGRLLGIAHAGKHGNDHAKITALQLRPVQLRISNKIARGPKEKPEQGLAEEALIEEGVIVIKPAKNS